MKTSHLKTKVELLKFRFKILFFGWLTLTIFGIFGVLKYDQLVNYKNESYETVAKFHACIFTDKLGLQKSELLPHPCRSAKYLKDKKVSAIQDFINYIPIYSLLTMFAGFAIILQNKGKNDGL